MSRILTAVSHGSFFAIGATVAAQLSPVGKASCSIAVMFGGLTLAMVVGVPMGRFIGNTFGWRLPFVAVVIVSSLALFGTVKWVPAIQQTRKSPVRFQLDAPVISMMAVTILGFGASFPIFSFITPILTDITGFSSHAASSLLVVFGVATLLGNMAGGRWASTLRRMLIVLAMVLAILVVALTHQRMMVPLLFVWGLVAFGMSPGFQAGMLETARCWTPRAIDFASALNIAGFNLGITLGET